MTTRSELFTNADSAAQLMTAMANSKRLMILCSLSEGEKPVGMLARKVGLSQSALSQHLAKLRALDLVSTRRDAQTIYYSIASPRVDEILDALCTIFCTSPAQHAA